MKVKYRGKTIEIQNDLDTSSSNHFKFVFTSTWNCYNIEILKEERHMGIGHVNKDYYNKHKYAVVVSSPFGSCIVDGYSDSTIKKCLQEAIDNIASDIDDLINRLEDMDEEQDDRDEIAYWIGLMKDL